MWCWPCCAWFILFSASLIDASQEVEPVSKIGMPLLLCFLLAAEPQQAVKFPIGKETTRVTGPLDKEGYIDFHAALNNHFGKGVTPETNANVLLWKALGPTHD